MKGSDSLAAVLVATDGIIDVLEAADDINTADQGFLAEYQAELSTTTNITSQRDDNRFIGVLQKYFMAKGGAK